MKCCKSYKRIHVVAVVLNFIIYHVKMKRKTFNHPEKDGLTSLYKLTTKKADLNFVLQKRCLIFKFFVDIMFFRQ